jgi:hypothetical protein
MSGPFKLLIRNFRFNEKLKRNFYGRAQIYLATALPSTYIISIDRKKTKEVAKDETFFDVLTSAHQNVVNRQERLKKKKVGRRLVHADKIKLADKFLFKMKRKGTKEQESISPTFFSL